MRLARFLAKRHQRGTASGFAQVYRARNTLGLISLNGIVVAPRPNRAWRARAEVNDVAEPCAGEPHARCAP